MDRGVEETSLSIFWEKRCGATSGGILRFVEERERKYLVKKCFRPDYLRGDYSGEKR